MYGHKNGCMFKKLASEDLKLLKSLKEDSWTTTHKVAFLNDEDQERWFASVPANVQHFICYTLQSKVVPIGFLSITTTDAISRVAQIGGSIFADHRGTEWSQKAWEAGTDFAFEMFNFHRIEGEVLENNVAALSMDMKLGYKVEGIRRKAVYKSGIYLDSYIVAYLREDWERSAKERYQSCCNTNFKGRRNMSKVLHRFGFDMPTEFVEQAVPLLETGIVFQENYDGPDAESVEIYHQAVS